MTYYYDDSCQHGFNIDHTDWWYDGYYYQDGYWNGVSTTPTAWEPTSTGTHHLATVATGNSTTDPRAEATTGMMVATSSAPMDITTATVMTHSGGPVRSTDTSMELEPSTSQRSMTAHTPSLVPRAPRATPPPPSP